MWVSVIRYVVMVDGLEWFYVDGQWFDRSDVRKSVLVLRHSTSPMLVS